MVLTITWCYSIFVCTASYLFDAAMNVVCLKIAFMYPLSFNYCTLGLVHCDDIARLHILAVTFMYSLVLCDTSHKHVSIEVHEHETQLLLIPMSI